MLIENMHSALKTETLDSVVGANAEFKLIKLQKNQNAHKNTLHIRPTQLSTSGIQFTDFLNLLGFSRSKCPFFSGEYYCCEINLPENISDLAESINVAYTHFLKANDLLEKCGIFIEQPEGYGYYMGQPSQARRFQFYTLSGDGHNAPKSERLKNSEDDFFNYVLTWIEGGHDKGWTIHIRAKHMPLNPEFDAALGFLGGFRWFDDCPEFGFEGCWSYFLPYKLEENGIWGNANRVHGFYDAYAGNFSKGLEEILSAHKCLIEQNFSFLKVRSRQPAKIETDSKSRTKVSKQGDNMPEKFDVALSFAGSERDYAKKLAGIIREENFEVFYDDYYPEQLWGRDLTEEFDRIFRKRARFCVMFISDEYKNRMWTTHERRCAQARALEEKGQNYILPVRVDQTDLDGLPPTIGYLSLDEYGIERIAEILLLKLRQ